MFDRNYNEIIFSSESYKEESSVKYRKEVNYDKMFDDISAFLKGAFKNGYQTKMYMTECGSIVVQYNYFDPNWSGVSLEWIAEDEFIAKEKPELNEM